MSVEKVGPKGYEYQYSASLLIALEYLDKDNLEIYIEKNDGEDAQIQFEDDDKKVIIDIQVKNRKESIDRKSFAKWLCHFDNRSSDKMLLNKLEENDNRFVVFISNARCNDEVSNFIGNDKIELPLDNSLKKYLLKSLKDEIYLCYKDNKSTLEKKRNLYVQDYVNKINNNRFSDVLKKVKVKELLTNEAIYNQMSIILNKSYHIPQSTVEQTILKLNELIKKGRDTGESITTKIRDIISEFSSETVLNKSENYIIRAEKDECIEILESKNVLLLTGISLCGKTYLARDIAEEYLEKGYNIKIVGELQGEGGAFSFINNSSIEDRLLILDDPFGHVNTKVNSKEIRSDVEKLVSMGKVSRKIIITSRKDILLNTMCKKEIASCYINGYNWLDVTDNSESKGKELWNSYYGTSEEYDEIYRSLNRYIKKHEKESYLQLGHIDRIFKSQINIKESTPEEIIKEARKDSQDLADVIDERGYESRKIFSVLGVTCNTYKLIQLNDLAFILEDIDEYPGTTNKVKTGLTFSLSYKEGESLFPVYSNNKQKLSREYIDELKYLNKYGYIEIDKLKGIRFTHPIYQYAAKLLFKSKFEDIFAQDEVIKAANKSCGSLSVDASLCTVSALEEMYIEGIDERDEIKKILLKALNTIFPSVRDKIIMMFDKKISDLNEDEMKEFVDVLKDANDIKNGGILWNDGIPWFNPSEKRGFESVLCGYEERPAIDDFSKLTSEQMWKFLNIRNTDTLQLNILEKALEYDESFIRERAINLIFKNYAYDFNEVKLNNYLDEYEHSNFIYGLFTGALNSWLKYKEPSRKLIVNYFKKSLGLMSLSIKARGILERFYEEHITDGIKWSKLNQNDKKILWSVWHEVFIEYLNKFPSKYMIINQERMTRAINESLEYVNSEQRVVELAVAWFNWLNKYDEYNYTFDFGISLARYLMDGTKENYEARRNLFKEMLRVKKTKFITTNVNIFIENWRYLCVNEKKSILDLISGDRVDIKWIQAVVLNIDNLCEEAQVEILGKTIEEFKIEEFIEKLVSKEILQECISMYCDYTYSGCDELWSKVIIEILKRDNLDRTFFIALKKILNILYHKYDEILNDYEFYISLLNNEEKRKLIFNELLMMSINCGESNKKMWDSLLEYSSDSEKKEYFNKIVESVELIEANHESYNGLYEVFSGSVIEKQIYSRLLNDKFFILMIESIKLVSDIFGYAQDTSLFLNDTIEKSNKQFEDRYMCELINNYKCNPPRLLLTDKIIKMELKELGIKSSELDTLMENKRKKYYEKVKNKTNYNEDYPLENWIE